MKQEELEKAAGKLGDEYIGLIDGSIIRQIEEAFEAGAKWHEQQGYRFTEEDMNDAYLHGKYPDTLTKDPKDFDNWLKERESNAK